MNTRSTTRPARLGPGVLVALLMVISLAALGLSVALPEAANAATADFRVNAGGPQVPGSPPWTADTNFAPSSYVNVASSGAKVLSTNGAVNVGPSVPAGTPAKVFKTQRYDPPAGSEMVWSFPTTPGTYDVRLFFAETSTAQQSVGARVFDVSIEGAVKLDHYDIFADAGANTGVMKEFRVQSDQTLSIAFQREVQNPMVNAIEILPAPSGPSLSSSPSSVDFGSLLPGTNRTETVSLTNTAGSGGGNLTINGQSKSGADANQFSAAFRSSLPITLAPGESTPFDITFSPTSSGARTASFTVTTNTSGVSATIPVSGTGGGGSQVGFGKSTLSGTATNGVTSLQFGPDNRLYAAQFNGLIKAYTIDRTGTNSYSVTATQTIDLVQKIPNHNDDGTLNPSVNTRIITGMLVTGTPSSPVIYVTSSDPRIGGGSGATDTNLDTNSSMLSKLTWNGTAWSKQDLVRGLPRSEENHSANGVALDPSTDTLYVAMGGNTNEGAPSNNFAFLPEYALSAAILSVDLDAIGNSTYDLPTLNDEDRPGNPDAGDPFGGDDGKNQAKLVPGGPVQVFASGFRNPYDLLMHSNGKLYTIDNGSNAGWGDAPVGEGPGGTCTNAPSEPGVSNPDTLHVVTQGYYGGHPNPTRANMANTFNSDGQSPVSVADPVECDYRAPSDPASTDLTTWNASTNGIDEYTASNFSGAMQGNILTAGYVSNSISRVVLNGAGTAVTSNTTLFSTVGSRPLDVTAQGDTDKFPGTIWVGDQGNGSIYVFEPNDFGSGGGSCAGTDTTTLDEDQDGYTNADEIDNNTNPCSSADVPPDFDNDHVSNLNDPDDDNDGKGDTSDPFAVDAANGLTTKLPVSYTWDNGSPDPGGLLDIGFTGLMTNGAADYSTLFNSDDMTAGGAAGVTTVDKVDPGTATGTANNQKYGFQFGFAPSTSTFTAHTALLAPFAGLSPTGQDAMGLFLGTGGQDDFVRVVTTAGNGTTGVQVEREVGGVTTTSSVTPVTLPGPNAVDLYLTVDPTAATVQASFTTTNNGVTSAPTLVGQPLAIPSTWLTQNGQGMAAGIISTSKGGAPFPATWDFIDVTKDGSTPPVVVAADGFGRSVSGGWGSADVGGAWKVASGASDFAVDGARGTINVSSAVGARQAVLTSTSASDVDASVTLGFSQLPTAGKNQAFVLLRRQSSGANYRVGVWVSTKGKVGLRAQTSSGTSVFPDVTTGLPWSAGSTYQLRVQVTGANPTTVKAKVWPTGQSEPSSWTASGTSTDAGLQGAGNIGVRAATNSTTTVTTTYDNLNATDAGG